MSSKNFFSQMNRAGMGIGLSQSKLSKAMLEILLKLPAGTTNLKDVIVAYLGTIGLMSTSRDINTAWNQTKKSVVKLYPDKFIMDDRNILHWNDGSEKVLDKKISTANFKSLNELADIRNCSVDKLISELIKYYKKGNVK